MAMTDLGTLVRQDLRKVWPSEPAHFTKWLADHLDQLGAELGLELELIRTESGVGDFSVDILARDLAQKDRTVVIENQLTPTDHKHLGQAITYAAGEDASAVVWVCPEIREEHRAAIDWLNRGLAGKTDFYAVVVEVLQIDDSKPAVNFRVVAWPAERTARQTIRDPEETTEKGQLYQQFFQRLLDELREKHRFSNARVGQPQNWYSFSSGVRGFRYSAAFKKGNQLGVEVYIDLGDEDQNLAALRALQEDKPTLEREIGEQLSWEELDSRRACRVALYRSGSIVDPQDKLDEYREWTVEKLLAFKAAFGSRIGAVAHRIGSG